MTAEKLARLTGRPVELMREMLVEDARRGLVLCRNRRWYLTEEAERDFGLALRGLRDEEAPA